MTGAAANDHSDLGALEDMSDLARNQLSENSVTVVGPANTLSMALGVANNNTGESYRSG